MVLRDEGARSLSAEGTPVLAIRPIDFGADWELRLGPNNCFRVFYQVKNDDHEVHVLAIGVKDRNRLFIGGKEFEE